MRVTTKYLGTNDKKREQEQKEKLTFKRVSIKQLMSDIKTLQTVMENDLREFALEDTNDIRCIYEYYKQMMITNHYGELSFNDEYRIKSSLGIFIHCFLIYCDGFSYRHYADKEAEEEKFKLFNDMWERYDDIERFNAFPIFIS